MKRKKKSQKPSLIDTTYLSYMYSWEGDEIDSMIKYYAGKEQITTNKRQRQTK